MPVFFFSFFTNDTRLTDDYVVSCILMTGRKEPKSLKLITISGENKKKKIRRDTPIVGEKKCPFKENYMYSYI